MESKDIARQVKQHSDNHLSAIVKGKSVRPLSNTEDAFFRASRKELQS